jgi:hypothetical protein
MAKSTKVSDRLKVVVNGTEHELLMTFGLLNELANLLGANGQIVTAAVDPDSRMTVLCACLLKRGKAGFLEGEFNIEEIDINPDTVIEIIEWAQSHVIDFFLKATAVTGRLGEKYGEKMASLVQSSTGSAPSPSTRDAVGSSTPSRAA